MRFAALAAALLLTLGAAPPGGLEVSEVDTTAFPEVGVTVDLPAGVDAAFVVREDGERRHVQAEQVPGEELSVALVVDTSGSMRGAAIAAARDAAIGFARGLPPGARTAVVGFGSAPVVASPLDADAERAVAALGGLSAAGETALHDAVLTALAELPAGGRRAIVLLSDGGDTVSSRSLDDAVAALTGSGVELAVIALQSDEQDVVALTRLAEAAGGRVVAAGDPAALAGVYEAIAGDLAQQYRLTWRSEAKGPVKVEVGLAGSATTATARLTPPMAEPEVADSPTAEPDGCAQPVSSCDTGGAHRTGRAQHIERAGSSAPAAWLVVGLAACFLGVALVSYAVLAPRAGRPRPGRLPRGSSTRMAAMSGLAERAERLAERGLRRRGRGASLNETLDRAGIDLRPGEFVVLCACGALTAGAALTVIAGPLLGVLTAALALGACRAVVSVRANRRRARFGDQLSDTLQLLASSLRAGYSLLQAIDAVAREAEAPTVDEFRRLVIETRLGRDTTEALVAMSGRVRSEDFGWVVQAIAIHREVGGNLADVLDTVAGTIRERNQIRRQVKSLSAEGRLSAAVLLALPFAVGGMILVTNPGYLAELTGGPVGFGLLALAAVLISVGAAWLRKVVRVVF